MNVNHLYLVSFLSWTVIIPAAPTSLWADNQELHLEIGDPARKGREVAVVLDAVTDTRSGDLLSPRELAGRLNRKRIVLVGESHFNMDFHRAQLRIIEELHQSGRPVIVGLEMYPYTSQEHLDNWVAGLYSEEGFLELSSWYESWGTQWDYYRDIFVYARDNRLRMYALNAPREVVAAVRRKGFDELTDEEKAHIPSEIDVESEEHLQLFKAFFAEEDEFHSSMTDEQWQGMFAAQCTWDATFAQNALAALEDFGDPNAILVVLVGSGHVVYDQGIQRQAAKWSDVSMASVVPIPVRIDDEDIETVRASYADFIWGLPPETDPLYPTLGISTRQSEEDQRRRVIHVIDESVGARAGFAIGDILLDLDGHAISKKGRLAQLVAQKHWGDTATVRVQRGEETLDLEVAFRRDRPDDVDDESSEKPQ